MAFFRPRIAAHVVAAVSPFFPEARPIFFHELNSANPFGTFPSVELWHDEPNGKTVVRGERLAVVFQGEQAVIVEEVVEIGRASCRERVSVLV